MILEWLKTTPQYAEHQRYQRSLEAPERPLLASEREALRRAQEDVERTIREKFKVEAPVSWQNPLSQKLLEDIQSLTQKFPVQ